MLQIVTFDLDMQKRSAFKFVIAFYKDTTNFTKPNSNDVRNF